jgi:thioredoxin-related protein
VNKLFIFISLFFSLSLKSQKVNWLSIEKAQELQKKVPKNIIMDIYTDWCGPCKLMDKNTFQNPDVAQYLNNNFYAVKFNAEGNTKVSFKGREFSNINYNESLKGGRNATHDFTRYLGISGYPTIVFFDKDANPIAPITGYLNPNQIEIYLKLFKDEKYKDIKSQEDFKKFMDGFTSEFKI